VTCQESRNPHRRCPIKATIQRQAKISPGGIGVLKIAMLEPVCGPFQARAIEFGPLESLIDEDTGTARIPPARAIWTERLDDFSRNHPQVN
jgi:hypothetical protein